MGLKIEHGSRTATGMQCLVHLANRHVWPSGLPDPPLVTTVRSTLAVVDRRNWFLIAKDVIMARLHAIKRQPCRVRKLCGCSRLGTASNPCYHRKQKGPSRQPKECAYADKNGM